MRKQVTHCDLASQNYIMNSKILSKEIGDLDHGVRIHIRGGLRMGYWSIIVCEPAVVMFVIQILKDPAS